MENFKFVNELVAKLPPGCHAAKMAQIEGVDVPVEFHNIPGVPSKKLYGKIVFDKYGGMKKNPEVKELWEIQAIFKVRFKSIISFNSYLYYRERQRKADSPFYIEGGSLSTCSTSTTSISRRNMKGFTELR